MLRPKDISNEPGVYLFKDNEGRVIYVGKAKNLKNRLDSYFSTALLPKTAQMMANANSLSYIKVMSEFEALLLEANLIKKYNPKYNIALKDDKSPLYVGITKDKFPRIITFRKSDLKNLKLQTYFGPYLSGYSANSILKKIRKIFPYSTHLPMKKICLYRQLGLCNPCPSEVENSKSQITKNKLRKLYLKNIRGVRNILSGKLGQVGKDLEKEIKELSKEEKFEEAKTVSGQLKAFQNIAMKPDFDIEEYLENPNLAEDTRQQELKSLAAIINLQIPIFNKNLTRIECFDIAHLSGTFPTASMVTFINGEADKKYYRHFKIYGNKTRPRARQDSDVDSMREVITRRLKHIGPPAGGWGRPDLIIIDGGKPQLSAVHDLLEAENISFIGLAKRLETIVIYNNNKFIEIKATGSALNLLQRIRDEAHRFARRLHHKEIRASMKL